MGYSTSVENQTAFIVPTNDNTRTIDYGMRFMITDNTKHPKTYEVTKVMDTFPLGTSKVTLGQVHYNEHTDFCGVNEDFFKDDRVHMLCNFYESKIKPINPINPTISNDTSTAVTWKLSKVNDKLYIGGQPQVIQAIPSNSTAIYCEWHIFIDGEEYTNRLSELEPYLDIVIDEFNNNLTITAINKDFAKYIVSIKIYDKARTYYDFVEMEVAI